MQVGSTQEEAANAVGCCDKTIRNWMAREDWADAERDAHKRWLTGLASTARFTLGKALEDKSNGKLALDVIERLDPALLPARMRHEVIGELPPITFTLTDDK